MELYIIITTYLIAGLGMAGTLSMLSDVAYHIPAPSGVDTGKILGDLEVIKSTKGKVIAVIIWPLVAFPFIAYLFSGETK